MNFNLKMTFQTISKVEIWHARRYKAGKQLQNARRGQEQDHFLNFLSASLIRHRGPWIFYADGMFSSQIDIGAAALEAATK